VRISTLAVAYLCPGRRSPTTSTGKHSWPAKPQHVEGSRQYELL